ncbi:hypothetical protein DPMN_040234 [Dreissena polymorpha]|uniref:Uncharacterized protein n=1 Tax=Dreissena polymorpha TaxID=45954 RepID=A0A9D4CWB1_DREPO|nr:hypothetical protein DPMN_040234 [Dreissena polymorpha]
MLAADITALFQRLSGKQQTYLHYFNGCPVSSKHYCTISTTVRLDADLTALFQRLSCKLQA